MTSNHRRRGETEERDTSLKGHSGARRSGSKCGCDGAIVACGRESVEVYSCSRSSSFNLRGNHVDWRTGGKFFRVDSPTMMNRVFKWTEHPNLLPD